MKPHSRVELPPHSISSSLSLSLSLQPNPKKEKLSPSLPPFPGFSKITPLPKSGRPETRTHNPLLRRCIANLDSLSVPSSTAVASPPSVISTRPPRTVSEPTSTPAAKSASSSGDDDTPSTKRIKDRFREMTLWFEQVMLEDVNDDDVIQVDQEKAPETLPEEQEGEQEGVQVINNCYYKLM